MFSLSSLIGKVGDMDIPPTQRISFYRSGPETDFCRQHCLHISSVPFRNSLFDEKSTSPFVVRHWSVQLQPCTHEYSTINMLCKDSFCILPRFSVRYTLYRI